MDQLKPEQEQALLSLIFQLAPLLQVKEHQVKEAEQHAA